MTIAAILGNKGREVISIAADQTVGDAVAVLASRRKLPVHSAPAPRLKAQRRMVATAR